MQAKLFVIGVFMILLGIIVGLFILFQKQAGLPTARKSEGNALSIGANQKNTPLPSGIPFSQDKNGQNQQQSPPTPTITNSPQPPPMSIDPSKSYSAVLETSEGDITIAFTANATPITVNNFIALARKDFYDNTIFHRILSGFMIQGGDPKGDGTGGPGYTFDDEEFDGEYTRGTVAMANSGKNTNGSQFFIMHKDSNSLPKSYVIFGKVTKGMDVVDAIAEAAVTTNRSGEQSKPVDPVVIENVKIIEE